MNKNYINTNKSIFLKYLFSYLFILIIPILIITFILSNTIFNILEKEILENVKASLIISNYNLTSELEKCHKINEQLNSVDKITSFKYEENISNAISTIDKLNKYLVSSNFFDKIFLHFFDDNYFYSNSSSYSLESFSNIYNPSNIILNKLNKDSNPNASLFIKDIENEKLFYSIPFLSDNEPVGIILFQINTTTLNKILGNDIGLNRQTYILDNNQTVLNLAGNDTNNTINNTNLFSLSYLDKKLNKTNYWSETYNDNIIFASKIKPFDIMYISITPSKTVFRDLLNVRNIMFVTIFIAFIFGIILIYILLKINYKPIYKLNVLSKNIKHPNKTNSYFNEIDLIENTLLSLKYRNNELENELIKNLPLKQNFILNELINGNIKNTNEFSKKCTEAKLNLSSPYHMIITIKSPLLPSSLTKILEDYNITDFHIDYEFLVNQTLPDLSIFLVGISTENLVLKNKYQLDGSSIISFGSPQKDLTHIPKSYLDSLTNLDFYNSRYWYEFMKEYDDKIDLIASTIISLDLLKLKELVFTVIDELNKETIPFEIFRIIYFKLIITINIFLEKNNHLTNYKNFDLSALYKINTKDSFNKLFYEFFNMIQKRETINSSKLTIEDIKELIQYNYCDYSFSLQLIADKFNVSLSYLSQYFKEKTNSTILDYITTLKMEKAKNLLLTSNMTLKDIAEQIGYVNVSSFIRRFKQVTGMTPGEYKKNNTKMGDFK